MANAAKINSGKADADRPIVPSLLDVLVMAACFGVVTGLTEGAGLYLFQYLGWLSWSVRSIGVAWEILWISPAFDLLLFVVAGIVSYAVARLLPRRITGFAFIFFALSFLMFLNWMLLSGRFGNSGCVMMAAGLASLATRWATPRKISAMGFFRRLLPAVVTLAAMLFVAVQGGGWLKERQKIASLPAASAGTPNVLVIVVDTLRADHLSGYGYPRATSPHLDRLAQQGVLFARAFATSSWTLPSHASLLTGRFPSEHRAVQETYDGRFPSIAEAFRDRGYFTAAFSANTVFFSRQNGFGSGFTHFEDYHNNMVDMAARTVYGRKHFELAQRLRPLRDIPGRKLASDVNRRLLEWLGRRSERPFFAFLNYLDVHDPYLPPQPFRSRFSDHANPGGLINSSNPDAYPKLSPDQLQAEIDAYDSAVAYLDDQLEQLMTALRKLGLLENTIVVITSDHGESFNEHGLFTHRNALYRNLIHVPLIVCWPGKVPVGMRVNTPVSNMSLAATLLELVGAGPQNTFPGQSLVPLWKNPGALQEHPPPLAELSQMPFPRMRPAPAYYGAMQSLVSSEWHYIHNEKLGDLLFDWAKDPRQLNNLAKTAEGRVIAEMFSKKLKGMLSGNNETSPNRASANGSQR